MKQILWTSVAVLVCLVFAGTECRTLEKRDADPSIDPHGSHEYNDDQFRDKRKIEAVVGVKNAILGFVFDKINKFIDQKTAWVDQLDKQNIAKNKAHHIEPPSDPVVSLSSILSSAIGSKLEAAAPLLNIRQRRSPKSALYGFAWDRTTTPKGPTTTEDVVLFTPGKPVSLELPGELFGSSFTLVTNLSTTVGDYMVNSAIRLQRLLESMRPFLRFVFGAKGIVIEGPTDKPIFSDPNEVKDNNL
ncbi:unnamed protein product [Ceutorhynchus assimilis]|uniref:Secreted protein n=1 Tax=Ceutorhynchus assimilis TaxID=467358 RepID=A0A9N9QKQ9_9CUCU|nr:unnamed protein product [Ceutorhynchus assimilis]